MARRIFIGDLQGCHAPFERLLDKLAFDSTSDRLYLAGDLVNRGGESLATLRRVHALRQCSTTVLGNHDLHLLAYAYGARRKPNAEFDEILEAPDAGELLDWLRGCPLIWLDPGHRQAMVHAGVDPRWSPEDAQAAANEVEQALAERPEAFFAHMYGDEPDRWRADLPREDRLRTLTNVLTRMRFCRPDGRLDMNAKGGVDDAPEGFAPWYESLHETWSGWTLVFGHWSQLGYHRDEIAVCLDSGCVWGGSLTALVIEADGAERLECVDCG
jgi:bis(5'-nucleosyl)-tetraphosphatase (symmetrical)